MTSVQTETAHDNGQPDWGRITLPTDTARRFITAMQLLSVVSWAVQSCDHDGHGHWTVVLTAVDGRTLTCLVHAQYGMDDDDAFVKSARTQQCILADRNGQVAQESMRPDGNSPAWSTIDSHLAETIERHVQDTFGHGDHARIRTALDED